MGDAIPSLRGRRVLLVEDDFLIGEALSDLLTEAGADVLGPVGWAGEALALVERGDGPIHVAVLDVDLHGQRSYPVADALMARGIPFVFTTGYNGKAVDPAYRDHPRHEKPVSGRVLLANLAAMLGPPRPTG